MTTAPQRGNSNVMPYEERKTIRVLVDGDMLRGVSAYDVLEGWADVLIWDDDGNALHDGESFVTKRVFGKVEVKSA